ncbi:MAG: hypothetical protein R3B40_27410 [Polyangiales bacterium]|nr:hypothetical protein [Myxococcales bacterium]MCB9656444.1 hypothetical protein [Sandaracinaceae bacterium]
MSRITASELHRRLVTLDKALAEDPHFAVNLRLQLNSERASDEEVRHVEDVAGIALPDVVATFLRDVAMSAQLCWHLEEDGVERYDTSWGGGTGGLFLLTPAEMIAQRERLLSMTEADPATTRILPFAKDPGAATWLAVYASRFGERIAIVHHDASLDEAEVFKADEFFEGWSRAGFPIEDRWEDQPEELVAYLEDAMGLEPEEFEEDE